MNDTIPNQTVCHVLDRVVTLEVFTSDQCKNIIDNGLNNWTEKKSMIKGNEEKGEEEYVEDLDYRVTDIFVPSKSVFDNLSDKQSEKSYEGELTEYILSTILRFNQSEEGYGFDIDGMIELPTLMRYQSSEIHPKGKSGKYDWHMDIGEGTTALRKLSYSILLNAGEYEGGELEFHIGRDTHSPFSSEIGNMILFPSYLVHKITPVTKGVRYAMVGWVHGNSFK